MTDQDRKQLLARATALCTVALGAFVVLITAQPFGEQGTAIADDVLQAVSPSLAAALSVRAARRARGSTRRAWRYIGLSSAAWAAGQLVWTFYEIVLGRETPIPSVADVGYLASPVLAVLGLLSFPAGSVPLVVRIRTFVDGVLIAALLLLVGWATFIGPLVHSSKLSRVGTAMGVAYPAADLALVAVIVLMWTRDRRLRVPSLHLLSAAFVVLAVTDVSFVRLAAARSYVTGDLVDVGWFAGYMLVALAALASPPKRPAPPALPREPRLSSAGLVLPTVLAGTAVALSLGGVGEEGASGQIPSWAFAGITLLAVARQSMSLLERHGLQCRLHRESRHDALTGLPNRVLATARLGTGLAKAGPVAGERCGLLLLDIDDFKTINDSLGHQAGDRLLRAVADRMTAHVRPGDMVARIGGDEFVVILEPVTDDELTQVAERVTGAFVAPFDLEGITVHAGVSVGVCSGGGDDDLSPTEMLRNADLAMYDAKHAGGGTARRFHPRMHEAVTERLRMETELRQALEDRAFSVAFQPVVDLRDLQIVGVEALVRWNHPERGVVPPSAFVPLAEETGLINLLGHWVLREAAFHASRWRKLIPDAPFRLAVNVSARQFERTTFACEVERVLTESGLPGDNLILELTETDLMRDVTSSSQQLMRLKALGVEVAIDDFGTGYSSLAYLRQFPVDLLKIDRSFVAGVNSNSDDRAVVEAVCQLGSALGLGVLGEGVEDTHQLDALRQRGCQYAQGFLFGRPMSPDAFESALLEQRAAASVVEEVSATSPRSEVG